MKRTVLFIAALFSLTAIFFSCDKTESYADQLKAQTKAINRFTNDRNITITNVFPKDSIFPENVYYNDPQTGVCFRVIKWGDRSELPILNKTEVSMKFYEVLNIAEMDTIGLYWTNDTQDYAVYPLNTRYMGLNGTYSQPFSSSDNIPSSNYFKYFYLSPGAMRPLDYGIGNGGEVSLIVPFTCGSYVQMNSTYVPYFYKRLKYIFI